MREGDAVGRAGRAWRFLLGSGRGSARARHGTAVGLALAAIGVGLLLRGDLRAHVVPLYLGAVGLGTLRGGAGPGMVALALCTAAYGAMTGAALPADSPGRLGLVHGLVLFVAFAALDVWVASALREGLRHAQWRRRRAEQRADEQRAAADRVRRMLASERFLAEASRQLALSIDWQETLARVVKLAVPALGDWCLLVVVGPDGRARSVVAEAADPARAEAARELLERYPIDPTAHHGVGRILRTGAPELIPEASCDEFVGGDPAAGELRREILRRLGMRSYMGAPLATGGRILGAVAFGVSEGPRRFGPEDLDLAQALAQRCAMAIENASLYRAAQDATRVREEVLAVVSHDLKTPLGVLLMGAKMVDRLAPAGAEGDALRRASSTVRRTAERMGRLIHDLVDVASIDAGRISLQLAEHDSAAVAREAFESVQGIAADRGVALGLDLAGGATIECDRDRLQQVLANLLTNAIQATETGGRVAVRVRPEAGEVVFTVSDSGPGIPTEDLPHVFERWYRGRGARYPGSGLGLAIARAIVDVHEGRIWAESQEGEGSAFSFALPVSPRARLEEDGHSCAEEPPGAAVGAAG